MDLTTLGFDPALAAHAAGSMPLYVAAFTVAKRMKLVGERIEMLAALAATASVNALVAVEGGTAALFPALSTATVGAVGAMMAHAMIFKKGPAIVVKAVKKPAAKPRRSRARPAP